MAAPTQQHILFANAFMALRELVAKPKPEIIERTSNGIVLMRLNGADGSYIAITLQIPVCLAPQPKLRILDICAWYGPASTFLDTSEGTEEAQKCRVLLLLLLDVCRSAVMKALGPKARHAAWWTDLPAMSSR